MASYKPVSVQEGAFRFCRYGMAILVWTALIFQIKWLLIVVAVIFILSALLKVQRSPMVVLYTYTVGKFFTSKDEVLNEHAMQFAHTLGALLSIGCIVFLYSINETVGWVLVFGFAVLKSISAFGYCPASKLYECVTDGGCCAITRQKK